MHSNALVISAVTQKYSKVPGVSLSPVYVEYNCASRIPRAILLVMAFEASVKKEHCYFSLMLCAVAILICFH